MFYTDPQLSRAHVLLIYFSFRSSQFSHAGLGVNAMHTLRVLRRQQVRTDAMGVKSPDEIEHWLLANPSVSHVVIEAPWIKTDRLTAMVTKFPAVHFLVRCHSQIGFLQVEAGAVALLREQLVLQEDVPNLTMSANSKKLTEFIHDVYKSRCLYLPNLYDAERVRTKRAEAHDHRELRIGSFGALRLLKNHATAAAAALTIARERNANLKFWLSVNREEHGKGVLQAIRNMYSGLPWATLVESPWEPWANFRQTVAHMDLCLQGSFTETFNIVSADAAAEGVPSVVSPAIEWCPDTWKADPDTIEEMSHVGSMLLSSHTAVAAGQKALSAFCKEATACWLNYLGSNPAALLAPAS